MTMHAPPKCYECSKFKSNPKFIGDSGKCTSYPRNIPKNIFYEGGKCTKLSEKVATAPKAKAPKKSK
jgi:hypothetical protein